MDTKSLDTKLGHELPQWVYQTKIGTAIYAHSIGEATTVVFEDRLKEEFLQFIPKGGKILEIGCGSGHQAIQLLKERPDLQIIASDLSSEMIEYAQEQYQETIATDPSLQPVQSRLSFVQANVMDLSQFESETFDGIYSSGAIKHFPDPVHALYECIRVLKPEGQMLFNEFLAEASVKQMTNLFRKHINMPFFLKPLIARLLQKKHKTMTPNKAEIENWKNELSSKGVASSEFLPEYPFFILNFHKQSKQLSNPNQRDSEYLKQC